MVELQDALKHLRRNNCVDSNGIVAECFFHARPGLHEQLFPVFTSMLLAGHVIKKGKQTTFQWYWKSSRVEPVRQKLAGPIGHRREKEMKSEQIVVAKYITNPEIPKTSDITNPENWRPFTLPNMTTKFLLVWLKNVWSQYWKPSNPMTKSDFVFSRSLDCCVQIYGVVGPDVVCKFEFAETALIILTTMRCSMLWRGKGVLYADSKCIATLYHDQVGLFKHDNFRSNGVWDKKAVLSSFLFNAGLEHARIK